MNSSLIQSQLSLNRSVINELHNHEKQHTYAIKHYASLKQHEAKLEYKVLRTQAKARIKKYVKLQKELKKALQDALYRQNIDNRITELFEEYV
jgi:hypothetical protein